MAKVRPAIVIRDIDGDGSKDLSIFNNDERILTIYNLKKWGMEVVGTAAAVFCALIGCNFVI